MKKSKNRVEIFYQESLVNGILLSYLRERFPMRRETKYELDNFEDKFMKWTKRFVTQKTTERKIKDGVLPNEVFIITGENSLPHTVIKLITRLKGVYPNIDIHIIGKQSIPSKLVGLVYDKTSMENDEGYGVTLLKYLEAEFVYTKTNTINNILSFEEKKDYVNLNDPIWNIFHLYEIIGFDIFVERFRLNPTTAYIHMTKYEKCLVDIKRSNVLEERNKLVENMKKFTNSLGDGEWYIVGEIYTHRTLSPNELDIMINKVKDVDVLVIVDISKELMTIVHVPWVSISFFNMILNVHFGLTREIDAYESRVTVSYKPIYHGMSCVDRMKEITYS